MIGGFMTALQVILLQLKSPRDQRAKSDLFQSTWKLCCRDSHKTQRMEMCSDETKLRLDHISKSLLTSCNCDLSATEVRDLHTCFNNVGATIEKSDAMLYTPPNNDITGPCRNKTLQCYMLELMVILEEEEGESTVMQCIHHFTGKLTVQDNCPECEIHPLQNSTTFFDRLSRILQQTIMSLN